MAELVGEVRLRGSVHRVRVTRGWTGRTAIRVDGRSVPVPGFTAGGGFTFRIGGVQARLRIEPVGPAGAEYSIEVEGRNYPLTPVSATGAPIPQAELTRSHLRWMGVGLLLAGALILAVGIHDLVSEGRHGIKATGLGTLMTLFGAMSLVESFKKSPQNPLEVALRFVGTILLADGPHRLDVRLFANSYRVLLDSRSVAEARALRRPRLLSVRVGEPPVTLELDLASAEENGASELVVTCQGTRTAIPRG